MKEEGLIYELDETDWTSSMVVVAKKDGAIRICMDPSKTINPFLVNDHFPLPKIDDLMMKFAG